MFFLAGLLGMMALGSVAIISTAAPDDPGADDLESPEKTDTLQPDVDTGADPIEGSLFSRMGLINMPGLEPGSALLSRDEALDHAEEAAWLAGVPEDSEDLEAYRSGAFDDDEADKAEADPVQSGLDTLFGGWENDLDVESDGISFFSPYGADTSQAADVPGFDAIDEDDQLVIVFDDSDGAPEPKVSMRQNQDDPSITEIVLNGDLVSTVPTSDAPPVSALVLIGESLVGELMLT